MLDAISITTFPLSDFTRATVFQLFASIPVSTSHHNRATEREAPSRKIHFSILRVDMQLAVPRRKITKKRGELIAATGTSITLYYTVEPFSLCDPSRGFPSIGDLSRRMHEWTEDCELRTDGERATVDRQR